MRTWRSIMGVTAVAAVAAAVVFGAAGGREKAIYWSADGVIAVKEAGAVGRQWKSGGYERGYGYPTTEISTVAVVSADGVPVTPERGGLRSGGVYQEF